MIIEILLFANGLLLLLLLAKVSGMENRMHRQFMLMHEQFMNLNGVKIE